MFMFMYVCKYMICIYIYIDVDMVLRDDSTCPPFELQQNYCSPVAPGPPESCSEHTPHPSTQPSGAVGKPKGPSCNPGSWVLGPGCSGILQVCSGSMPHLQVWIIWGLWNLWIIPGKGYYTNHYTILYIIIRYYTGYTQKQPTTVSAGKDFFNNAWCAIGRRQVPQEISAGDSGDFEMEGLSCGLVSRW